MNKVYKSDKINIYFGDVLNHYKNWSAPNVIISDGPYGIGSFPGDPPTPESLPKWYEPHIEQWSKYAQPAATLWFWNTEIGWAKVHPILERYGWTYKNCNIWNKGIAHIAGNTNSKSLSRLPVVTEICVQYVKEVKLPLNGNGVKIPLKDWLRKEWQRTKLPFSKTNEACGVKNAATRKYFTKCHLWYFPPLEAFEKIVTFANKFGSSSGRPYFSIDGIKPLTKEEWAKFKPKFKCPIGITNVWNEPAVRGQERVKNGYKAIHINQKPLKIMELLLKISSEEGDVIWEPFGGLCSAGVAASKLKRMTYCAEVNPNFYQYAIARFSNGIQEHLLT